MKINQINISKLGHNKSFHTSQMKILEELFLDTEFNIKFSDTEYKENSINFLIDGWTPKKQIEVEKFLNNQKNIFGIVFTEIISYHKDLKPKFATINNFLFQNNEKLKKIYLVILHWQVKVMNFGTFFFKKSASLEEKLTKIKIKNLYFKKLISFLILLNRIYSIPFYLISKNLYGVDDKSENYIFGWFPMFKNNFNYTFKLLDKFKIYINLGLDDDKSFLFDKSSFYYNLPYLFFSDKVPRKEIEKKYDLIFFGRITKHRSILINKIKKLNLNFLIIDCYISNNDLENLILRSKFIINCDQYKAQNFISVAKVFEGLKYSVPNLVQIEKNCNKNPSYIKKIIFEFDSENLEKIREYVDNYEIYQKSFMDMKKKYVDFSVQKKNEFLKSFKNFLYKFE